MNPSGIYLNDSVGNRDRQHGYTVWPTSRGAYGHDPFWSVFEEYLLDSTRSDSTIDIIYNINRDVVMISCCGIKSMLFRNTLKRIMSICAYGRGSTVQTHSYCCTQTDIHNCAWLFVRTSVPQQCVMMSQIIYDALRYWCDGLCTMYDCALKLFWWMILIQSCVMRCDTMRCNATNFNVI